jgi:thiamine-monophosphate kinase
MGSLQTIHSKPSVLDHNLLHSLRDQLPYHPRQVNRLLTADAEIIDDLHYPGRYVVLKTDAIHEEIVSGLYKDPFTIGWVAVTAAVSDLAAAGASPDALTLLLQIPRDLDGEFFRKMVLGVKEAAECYGSYIAGGDLNYSPTMMVSVTAMGRLHGPAPVLRTGCQPGDLLYISSYAGDGSRYAFNRFLTHREDAFLPIARLRESKVVTRFATSCINTSDGLIPAIAEQMELNSLGFNVFSCSDTLVNKATRDTCLKNNLPCWLMFAGPHGDYELLFTIPQELNNEFLAAATEIEWEPILAGEVVGAKRLTIRDHNRMAEADAFTIANLFADCDADPARYLEQLMQLHRSMFN